MEYNPIKNRLRKIIQDNELISLGFLSKQYHISPFTNERVEDLLVRRLIEDTADVKQDFIDTIMEYDGDCPIRVCSECGSFMIEGYYLDGEYACSEECAIKNYMESFTCSEEEAKKIMDSDLEVAEDDVYYTAWE